MTQASMRAKRSFVRVGGSSILKLSRHRERSSSIFNDRIRTISASIASASTCFAPRWPVRDISYRLPNNGGRPFWYGPTETERPFSSFPDPEESPAGLAADRLPPSLFPLRLG